MKTATQIDACDYRPSEYRAILVHKYYLGIERGYGPSMDEAIESWETHHAMNWRNTKMRRDVEAQIKEIEAHRAQLSIERGTELTWKQAAKDWVNTREPQWRDQWEATLHAGA